MGKKGVSSGGFTTCTTQLPIIIEYVHLITL